MSYQNRHAAPSDIQPLIDEFLDTLRAAGQRRHTIDTRRRQLVRVFREINPLTVSEHELVQWLASREWGPETRKSTRSVLRAFFSWLVQTGRRGDDPAIDLPGIRIPKPQPRPCPDDHVTAALRHAGDEGEIIMVRAAAELGLRRGEIARLNSDDVIDDQHGKALIVHGKGGKERTLPIPDDLASLLAAYDGYVFPGRFGDHVEESYVGVRLSRLLPAGWSGHTLRHRFATKTYGESRDLLMVSIALGHESVATTQRYVKPPDDAMRALMAHARLS